MGEFLKKMRNLSPEELNKLLVVLFASMFGSLGTTGFVTWMTEGVNEMAWAVQLLLIVSAVVIYALIVWLTFYIFSPESRPALRRMVTRDK